MGKNGMHTRYEYGW